MRGRSLDGEPPKLTAPTVSPTLSVQLEVVTPLAGHTASKSATSTTTPPPTRVREASVANLIRRWWRICFAGRYPSSKALFTAEAERFGAAGQAGQVRVVTGTISDGTALVVPDRVSARGHISHDWESLEWPPYAMFPWEPVSKPPFTQNVTFRVEITAPVKFTNELEVAMAAWVHLGGVGQRTHRGMGSLRCTGGPLLPLASVLAAAEAGPALVTTLPSPGNVLVHTEGNYPEAVGAWAEAVDMYRYFRQGEGFAREESRNYDGRPGQSHYPEADSIRRWSGIKDHPIHILFDGFPRADLGLPIIFEFKAAEGVQVPPKTELNSASRGRSRFASPVITKAWWDANTCRFRPLIAIMNAPHAWEGGSVRLRNMRNPHQNRAVTQAEIELDAQQRDRVWVSSKSIRQALLERCVAFNGYGPIGAKP